MQHTDLAHMNMMHILQQHHKNTISYSDHIEDNQSNTILGTFSNNIALDIETEMDSFRSNLKFVSNTAVWASNFLYYSLKPISANAMFTSNTAFWSSNSCEKLKSQLQKKHARFTILNDSTIFQCSNDFKILPSEVWTNITEDTVFPQRDESRFYFEDEGNYTFCFNLCFAINDGKLINLLVSLVDDDMNPLLTNSFIPTPQGSVSSGCLTTHVAAGRGLRFYIACVGDENTRLISLSSRSQNYLEITKLSC